MAQQPEYVPDFVVETAHYLLVPHDLVTQDKRQIDFLSFEISTPS